MNTFLSTEALDSLKNKLDHLANVNALMYDDLDTIDDVKNILTTLNTLSERLHAALTYIDAHREDFESEAAMTGHEQVIFRFVAQVLRGNG